MRRDQLEYGQRYSIRSRLKKSQKRYKINFQKAKIIFLLTLFLILALSYVFLFSPIFKIEQINISGNKTIKDEQIKDSLNSFLNKQILIFFDRNNLFLATSSKIKNILSSQFSKIASVQINKSLVKRFINLKIVERKEVGIFCREKKCYYIDQQGIAFEKAPETKGTLILVIKDNSQSLIKIGDRIIEKDELTSLVQIKQRLTSQLGLGVLNFEIEANALRDLRASINQGWYILFDWTKDLEKQVEALKLILSEKIKKDRINLEYVDLRIEGRAYYKVKEN